MATKEAVKAVYDDDLVALLTGLGLHNKFAAGKLKCAICGDVVTWDNLSSIFPESGQVKVSCSRPECVARLAERVSKAR